MALIDSSYHIKLHIANSVVVARIGHDLGIMDTLISLLVNQGWGFVSILCETSKRQAQTTTAPVLGMEL